MTHRIDNGVERSPPVRITVDGHVQQAHAGETVATVLLAAGVTVFHRGSQARPRGPYCNMGTCFECLVQVAYADAPPSDSWVRACMTLAEEGMQVTTGVNFARRPLGTRGEGT